MPGVVHFDLPADDPEKLKCFYEDVFNWQFKKWNEPGVDYWLIYTGEDEAGINGGMVRKKGLDDKVTNTINVPDIDLYIEKIKINGGTIVQEKMPIKSVGWIAGFLDPQGNKHMIIQDDTTAS
ncbi:MAG: VOC family protein [bacterium]|nr:VOC family protein [bacterium]